MRVTLHDLDPINFHSYEFFTKIYESVGHGIATDIEENVDLEYFCVGCGKSRLIKTQIIGECSEGFISNIVLG